MAKIGYGVDVGGTAVKIGRFTDSGELLYKWSIVTDTTNHSENLLPDIAAAVEADIKGSGFSRDDVIGIGIGVPGPLDDKGLTTCVNLGWSDFPVAEKLGEIIDLPIKVVNDANSATLGEMWAGSAKGQDNVLMVTLGTGVGGGIVIGGKLLTGAHFGAGELGHIPVNFEETRPCNCGNCGCLEQYASANGNVRVAEDYLKECDTPSPLRSAERINSKLCWDLAIDGDPVAIEIAERFSRYLGIGLAMAAGVVDPGVIIIGGGVSRTGEPLRAMVEKYFKKYAFKTFKNTPILIASLGNDAGMYGCMYSLLN